MSTAFAPAAPHENPGEDATSGDDAFLAFSNTPNSIRATAKPPFPPKYSAKLKTIPELDAWRRSVKGYCRQLNVEPDSYFGYYTVIASLDGDPLRAIIDEVGDTIDEAYPNVNLDANKVISPWTLERIYDELKFLFIDPHAYRLADLELDELRQGHMSVQEYATKILGLSKQIPVSTPYDRKKKFLNHMDPDIAKLVYRQYPDFDTNESTLPASTDKPIPSLKKINREEERYAPQLPIREMSTPIFRSHITTPGADDDDSYDASVDEKDEFMKFIVKTFTPLGTILSKTEPLPLPPHRGPDLDHHVRYVAGAPELDSAIAYPWSRVNTPIMLRMLDVYKQGGQFEPTTLKATAPLAPVIKKDGSGRPVGNLRKRNTITVSEKMQPVDSKAMVNNFAASKYRLIGDMLRAFEQLRATEDAERKNILATPVGNFMVRTAMQGDKNSPQTLQKNMLAMLEGMTKKSVDFYADDVCAYGNVWRQFKLDVLELFSRFYRCVPVFPIDALDPDQPYHPAEMALFDANDVYLVTGHTVNDEGIKLRYLNGNKQMHVVKAGLFGFDDSHRAVQDYLRKFAGEVTCVADLAHWFSFDKNRGARRLPHARAPAQQPSERVAPPPLGLVPEYSAPAAFAEPQSPLPVQLEDWENNATDHWARYTQWLVGHGSQPPSAAGLVAYRDTILAKYRNSQGVLQWAAAAFPGHPLPETPAPAVAAWAAHIRSGPPDDTDIPTLDEDASAAASNSVQGAPQGGRPHPQEADGDVEFVPDGDERLASSGYSQPIERANAGIAPAAASHTSSTAHAERRRAYNERSGERRRHESDFNDRQSTTSRGTSPSRHRHYRDYRDEERQRDDVENHRRRHRNRERNRELDREADVEFERQRDEERAAKADERSRRRRETSAVTDVTSASARDLREGVQQI
ncbi:hypothetical protein JCM1841_005555 [Sporobolomyces salmonicolor]